MDIGYGIIIVFAGAALIAIINRYWRGFAQWLRGWRGRNWPTLTATIDLVDVIEQRGGKHGEVISNLATLTYIYRAPELQTGEYCRVFAADDKQDAEAWAASYKGSNITVHVDPRDPARSVLQKEDL